MNWAALKLATIPLGLT